MIATFLNKKGHDDLILFFNGWGMDHTRFLDWPCEIYDLLTVHDFAQLSPLPDLSGYKRIHLIAWSLGVWVAAHCLAEIKDSHPFTTCLAMNGTLNPIDAQEGIPPEVFDGTIDNWKNLRTREKFAVRISGMSDLPNRRLPQDQHIELLALRQLIKASPQPANIFTTVLISTRDRIFPLRAQRHFWTRFPEIRIVEKPMLHDPFVSLSSWEEVLTLAKA